MSTYAKMGEGGTHPESGHSGKPTTLGIYIQVPFCQTKCTYCNFHTGVASPAAYAPYARAVEREIRDWRALHAAANLESVSRLVSVEQPGPWCCRAEKWRGNHAAFSA